VEVKYNARTRQQFESWGSQVKKIAFWEVGGSNLGRIQVKQQHMERGEVTTLFRKKENVVEERNIIYLPKLMEESENPNLFIKARV
jgi:hypothetical protein